MNINLQHRVALVTGATRGIGRAIADCLAANGATVYGADLGLAEAPHSLVMDVTNPAQIAAALAQIEQEQGQLDILVNNAGVNTLAHRVNIDAFPQAEWDRILAVDLTGVYQVSRAAIPLLRRAPEDGRRIVNIASVAGLVPLRLQCAFTAAKAGVINLTKAMALELGPESILVNAIAPGSILTQGTEQLFYGEDGLFKDSVQRLLDHIPLGRPGKPEEIAHAALFLVAPESSYINGHCLTVDGGWTAGYHREF
ncbi:SDR family NAD(P)-dependent oxidoreductase [Armatimonas sp.]|uniref:SDR family NAD(P)-dependent oxidoreductase n=1 Tax=Armatimonas sp. TaxID=1872638 RepID=UPI00374DDE7B